LVHRCFNSINDQVGHVVIIDNGSDAATREELDKIAASDSVTLILNERNEGIARAFNQGVDWARSKGFERILTLDHDSEATPDMVDKLLNGYATLEAQGVQNVGVICANAYDINSQYFISGCSPAANDALIDEGEVISSGSLIEARVFDCVGPFNEEIFVHYVDIDFCVRLQRGGFRVYLCPDAVLLHQEGTKERMRFIWRDVFYDRYSNEARYYLTRNTLYLMKRHFPLKSSITRWILRRLLMDHVKILLFDRERFVLFWFSLRGFVDGLRGRVGGLWREETSSARAG
jgi:rhamnosyltransferase